MIELDELDKTLLKHFLRLCLLRGLSVFGYYLMFMDAFMAAFVRYPDLLKKYKAGAFGNVTKANSKTLYCDFRMKWKTKDLETQMATYKFNLFLLMGFMGFIAVCFFIKLIVFMRLILCPFKPDEDKKDQPVVNKWTKLKDTVYRFSTLIGDLPGIAVAVSIYGNIRGKTAIACWECLITKGCVNLKTFNKLISPSELAIDVLYPAVVFLTFYKVYYAYYVWSNPTLCECYCECLRCISGCFLATMLTIMLMTPGWMVLNYGYYTQPGVAKDIFSSLTSMMMLIGAVIWAVLLLLSICIPVKHFLLAEKKEKK